MKNARNGQELDQYLRELTEGYSTSGLVPAGMLIKLTGWDHTKNIGAIMVSSPPRTRKRKKPQQQERLRRINRKQGE